MCKCWKGEEGERKEGMEDFFSICRKRELRQFILDFFDFMGACIKVSGCGSRRGRLRMEQFRLVRVSLAAAAGHEEVASDNVAMV